MISNALVAVRNLSRSYRRGPEEVHAVRHASFQLEAGEVVALLGPSGSGKTTLLNLLCGWERPDEGEILWANNGGIDPADLGWSQLSIVPRASARSKSSRSERTSHYT